MFLGDFIGKNLYSSNKLRGVCLGVALSLKSKAVRYLVCIDERGESVESDSAGGALSAALREAQLEECACQLYGAISHGGSGNTAAQAVIESPDGPLGLGS